jgi:hypothetical protein
LRFIGGSPSSFAGVDVPVVHELAGGLDALGLGDRLRVQVEDVGLLADVLAGSRWQSRQKPMLIGFTWVTTSISFILPWHSTQLMPRFTWIEWSNRRSSGITWTWTHGTGLPGLEALPDDRQRGARRLDLAVAVHARLRRRDRGPAVSIVLWQYRQSRPSSPTCFAWLYGTGWIGA